MKGGGVGSWFFWSEQSIVAHDAVVPARIAGPPSWLIGIVGGIAALSVVGRDIALFTLALFTSLSGIAFAAIGMFWIAAGVVAVIDPKHAGRNAAIVATVIVASVVLYLSAASSRPSPPGRRAEERTSCHRCAHKITARIKSLRRLVSRRLIGASERT
jgi:hypothetical protein